MDEKLAGQMRRGALTEAVEERRRQVALIGERDPDLSALAGELAQSNPLLTEQVYAQLQRISEAGNDVEDVRKLVAERLRDLASPTSARDALLGQGVDPSALEDVLAQYKKVFRELDSHQLKVVGTPRGPSSLSRSQMREMARRGGGMGVTRKPSSKRKGAAAKVKRKGGGR